MKIIKQFTVIDAYRELINSIVKSEKVGNTYEIENCIIEISKPSLSNIYFENRKISKRYANAELAWYWSADNSCETIGKYAKKWLEITDDGTTNNSAYGHILFKKYDKNQLEEIIKLLETDKDTRRAVLNISDPSIDKINTKDMQCTIALQFLYRNDELNMSVYMRSNDVVFGFPYDYIFFETIHRYVAERLNVKVGKYTHFATSMHLYERDLSLLQEHNQIFTIDYKTIIKENYHEN